MTSQSHPDRQTALSKQFAPQGVCVSSGRKVSELVSASDSLFVSSSLLWIFSCKHSTVSFLASSFWDAQTDSVWLSTHNSQHLLKMSVRNAQAHGPVVTFATLNAFTWCHKKLAHRSRENYCLKPEFPCRSKKNEKKIITEIRELSAGKPSSCLLQSNSNGKKYSISLTYRHVLLQNGLAKWPLRGTIEQLWWGEFWVSEPRWNTCVHMQQENFGSFFWNITFHEKIEISL